MKQVRKARQSPIFLVMSTDLTNTFYIFRQYTSILYIINDLRLFSVFVSCKCNYRTVWMGSTMYYLDSKPFNDTTGMYKCKQYIDSGQTMSCCSCVKVVVTTYSFPKWQWISFLLSRFALSCLIETPVKYVIVHINGEPDRTFGVMVWG